MTQPGPPARCPVGPTGDPGWLLTRHADVVAAASDPVTFSSAVSRHLQVPNGLDGEEHARFRPLVDSFFAADRMAALEPLLRPVAAAAVAALPVGVPVDAVEDLGRPYAVRATCTWLGWPDALEPTLLAWMAENHAATASGDPGRTAAVAARFDEIIRSLTEPRRAAGDDAPDDVTSELVRARVEGRALTDEEVVSVLRNWTAGDISSVALCAGVVVRHLAARPEVQRHLRTHRDDAAALDRAVDELLRIEDPFLFNRRVATRDTTIGGARIAAGERVLLAWPSANRDPDRFGDPDAFRPDENAPHNLVYGTGPHVCPGRPLAALELRVVLEELLDATARVEQAPTPDDLECVVLHP
ncbi:cytochrome P450 [Nocardioides solisilvae]|uniref:cytochrome P450 n=1 Tax=Nocardioides solisilvae TaxID=1542435 RepID=UPI0019514570|nr:cytochrome P450 [Nocardioides solisilvae]